MLISTFDISLADSYVVAWKRGIAILTAGSVKVTPDPRVRLVNGFNLQIRDALPTDAGDYICQIATMDPREITHTVEILGEYYNDYGIYTIYGLLTICERLFGTSALLCKVPICRIDVPWDFYGRNLCGWLKSLGPHC